MLKKLKDTLIYRSDEYFSSFPALVNLGDGLLVAAFRRAPRYRGLPGLKPGWFTHLDRNSKLMLVFSEDGGETWGVPRLLFAPPDGATQDGGLFFDGNILFANSFIWGNLPDSVIQVLRAEGKDEFIYSCGGSNIATHIGSLSLRSFDRGGSWEGPFFPDPLPGGLEALPGRPLRMHNRANIIRTMDGRLLFPGQSLRYRPAYRSSIVLYESWDDGQTWHYFSTPAPDREIAVFEEPCVCEYASGKLSMLIRTHKGWDGVQMKRAVLYATISEDGGRTWSDPVNTGVHGEPAAMTVLPDGRVLSAYGYRKPPEGVRARICSGSLEDFRTAEEYILRDDAKQSDCGYPWIAPLGNGRYCIAYYLNPPECDGTGGIWTTVVEVK